MKLEAVSHRLHHHHQHYHGTVGAGSGKNAAVIAYIFEIGISLHSVIIGLALGVNADIAEVRALFIALAFHQAFEGVALGVSVAEAGLSKFQRAVAVCSFTLATPVGIAIGLGLASQQSTGSYGLLLAQGILDSVSTGILVYMALVDMISESFQAPCIADRRLLRLAMLVAIFFGAAMLALIGLWA
jgi:zinc transporter 1/2/3